MKALSIWLLGGLLVCTFSLMSASLRAADLYSATTYSPLTSDLRSFRVGDPLTVSITEQSSAESDAESDADRSLSATAGVNGVNVQHSVGLSLGRQGDNSASTTRNGTLQALVTVHVVSVAPNGDLSVHGKQSITVNGETQRIELSGVVRPIDVEANNVVLSSRLSDAKIDYSGKGFVQRGQRESLISRILDYVGL